MNRFAMWAWIACSATLLISTGCDKDEPAAAAPSTQPVYGGAGGAPTFGTASGMGFSTGDAAHSDGQGSGLMGYHGTGSMGASGAITDKHEVVIPRSAVPTTEPVLPAP
jgi:hypothetical protein